MRLMSCGPALGLLVVLGLSGCQHGGRSGVCTLAEEQMKGMVSGSKTQVYIPGYESTDVRTLSAKPQAQGLLAWARSAAAAPDIPATTYSLYRRFREAGERAPYEGPYFQKRDLLAREVMAVWLGGDASRLGRVNNLIWSICEESTWVVPAHEKGPGYIDLFSAETAATLGHTTRLLGEQLTGGASGADWEGGQGARF